MARNSRIVLVRDYTKKDGTEVSHHERNIEKIPEREKYERPKSSIPKFKKGDVVKHKTLSWTAIVKASQDNGKERAYTLEDDYGRELASRYEESALEKKPDQTFADLPKDDAVREYRSKNKILRIYQDSDPTDPRSLDYTDSNVGIMICSHKAYTLGDKQIRDSEFESWNNLEEKLKKDEKAIAILPLYLYDHSGITMRTTPFGDRWDSGQVGFIYTTKEKMKDRGKVSLEEVKDWLREEVKTYDQYLTGDVYGFKLFELKNGTWQESDSSWGYYGSDDKESGILDAVPKSNWKRV